MLAVMAAGLAGHPEEPRSMSNRRVNGVPGWSAFSVMT
jgi:hypothetical protein